MSQAPSLVSRMAGKYGVEPDKMLSTLKATAFKGDVSNEQLMALLIVAEQHGLNPWTKEIYAFPDRTGIVPVVSVDGWSRIINEHPQMDGISLEVNPEGTECVAIIHR
jgi:phage recombination protein Bet